MGVFDGADLNEIITPTFVSSTVDIRPPGALPSDAGDTIYGMGGSDTIDGGGGNDSIYGDDYTERPTPGVTYEDSISGGAGDDMIDGATGADHVDGGAGNDSLLGGRGPAGGNDTLIGGAGSDSLSGETGNDSLDGGSGLDFASFFWQSSGVRASLAITGAQDTLAEGIDTFKSIEGLWGGFGNDTLTGDAGANSLYGALGDDWLDGGGGKDFLSGSAPTWSNGYSTGNDTLFGRDGADTLVGASGYDSLYGGAGNDNLSGGDYNDWLYGGPGNDVLSGGIGRDFFGYIKRDAAGYGQDVITDFQPGQDKIRLEGYSASDVTINNATHTISLSDGTIITFENFIGDFRMADLVLL